MVGAGNTVPIPSPAMVWPTLGAVLPLYSLITVTELLVVSFSVDQRLKRRPPCTPWESNLTSEARTSV